MYEMSNMTNNSPSNESRLNKTYDNLLREESSTSLQRSVRVLYLATRMCPFGSDQLHLTARVNVLVCSFAFCALWHELTLHESVFPLLLSLIQPFGLDSYHITRLLFRHSDL